MAIIPIPRQPGVSQARPMPTQDVQSAGMVGRAALELGAQALGTTADILTQRNQARKKAKMNLFNSDYVNGKKALDSELALAYQEENDADALMKRQRGLIDAFQERYSNAAAGFGEEFQQAFRMEFEGDMAVFNSRAGINYDKTLDRQNEVAFTNRFNNAITEMARYSDNPESPQYKNASNEFDKTESDYIEAFGPERAEAKVNAMWKQGLHSRLTNELYDPLTSKDRVQEIVDTIGDQPGADAALIKDIRRIGGQQIRIRHNRDSLAIKAFERQLRSFERDPVNNKPPSEEQIANLELEGVSGEAIELIRNSLAEKGGDYESAAIQAGIERGDKFGFYNITRQKLQEKMMSDNPVLSRDELEEMRKDIMQGAGTALTAENRSALMSDLLSYAAKSAQQGDGWFADRFHWNSVGEDLTDEQRVVYVSTLRNVQTYLQRNELKLEGEDAQNFFRELDSKITEIATGTPVESAASRATLLNEMKKIATVAGLRRVERGGIESESDAGYESQIDRVLNANQGATREEVIEAMKAAGKLPQDYGN